jgi:antitoxin (DNA-binding transcriptional repressor) of toxin-antitoxin stability system
MKQMGASVFKACCLRVIADIQATGEPVVVTKRGKPIVKVTPAEPGKNDIFGFMESPVVPLSHWKTVKK